MTNHLLDRHFILMFLPFLLIHLLFSPPPPSPLLLHLLIHLLRLHLYNTISLNPLSLVVLQVHSLACGCSSPSNSLSTNIHPMASQ